MIYQQQRVEVESGKRCGLFGDTFAKTVADSFQPEALILPQKLTRLSTKTSWGKRLLIGLINPIWHSHWIIRIHSTYDGQTLETPRVQLLEGQEREVHTLPALGLLLLVTLPIIQRSISLHLFTLQRIATARSIFDSDHRLWLHLSSPPSTFYNYDFPPSQNR